MLNLVINAIIPVFGLIFIGYFAARTKILGEGADKIITRFVYYFALPILFFVSTATEHISTILNMPFITAFVLVMVIFYVVGMGYSQVFYKKNLNGMAMRALSVSCPNAAFMGIPILLVVVGKKGVLPAALASIITVLPLALSILFLEIGKKDSEGSIVKTLLSKLLLNPLVFSTLLGILYSLTGLKLYAPFVRLFHDLGFTSGACALFALGMSLYGKHISKQQLKEIGGASIIKLILQPLVALPLVLLFKVDTLWAASAFIMAALPTGAFVYILAQEYDHFIDTSIAIVIGTTLLSIITLPFCILAVGHFWPSLAH